MRLFGKSSQNQILDQTIDAVVSIDSFPYYGTDDAYLNYIARFVKSGGAIIYVLPETRPLHQVFGPKDDKAPIKVAPRIAP